MGVGVKLVKRDRGNRCALVGRRSSCNSYNEKPAADIGAHLLLAF